MIIKPVIISSSGLKNIVLNKYQEDDDFIFVFGEAKFQMKSFFAEFISPIVSHLHQTDPTINSINFSEINGAKQEIFNIFTKSLITSDTISLLHQISSVFCIEINEEQAMKMRLLSIILGNEELYRKLNDVFPADYNEENVNTYMKNIECLFNFSQVNETFDISSTISFIASHFYMVDVEEFLRLSHEIQYMIISHHELQIESEDSLFDIISQIIKRKKDDRIEDILFLEQIELCGLSEVKFREFISVFDFNDMSGQLWQNLRQCFFPHPVKKCVQRNAKHHQMKIACNLQNIIVGGADSYYVLGEKPNNEEGDPIISPPTKLSFDSSSLLSYSAYSNHSVMVRSDGSLKGIGNNWDGRISPTLQKASIDDFTDFCIKDGRGNQLTAISAACYSNGTLYMFSKNDGSGRQLVFCNIEGKLKFLDIGNHQPMALFNSCMKLGVIGSEGEFFIINYDTINKSPIEAHFLPDGEKATSIVFFTYFVFVLSSSGRVFKAQYFIEKPFEFSIISELSGHEIVCIFGTNGHCLAVSKEGHVFGCGSNEYGQLGFGNEIKKVSTFTEISSLVGYEIRAAYAGGFHSFFETQEGKILSCGSNSCGELLLSSGRSENVYFPTETMITGGATFCIAGFQRSIVLIGSKPPPNMPNMRIQKFD